MNTTLCDNIDWVGASIGRSAIFIATTPSRGATYNAYLLRDEKTALIDTVKAPFADELLRNVAALVEPAQVDYVVCNHAELDHAGALPQVMQVMPRATLLCDKKCAATLARAFRYVGVEDSGRGQRRDGFAGPAHAAIHRNADGPLARVDVYLRARGEAAVLDGRFRPALRHAANDSTTRPIWRR